MIKLSYTFRIDSSYDTIIPWRRNLFPPLIFRHPRRPSRSQKRGAPPVVACATTLPLCVRERVSAPKRGRHSTIFFPTKCICAVAAWWFDNPRQKVVPRSRIPRSTFHFSGCTRSGRETSAYMSQDDFSLKHRVVYLFTYCFVFCSRFIILGNDKQRLGSAPVPLGLVFKSSRKMGPAPGIFALSKGILKWI